MIAVLLDLLQSVALLILAVGSFFTVRRLTRVEMRTDSQRFIRDRQASREAEEKPTCGCGHHQCFHDETGCGAMDLLFNYGDQKTRSCGCKRYTGPEQLPTVIP